MMFKKYIRPGLAGVLAAVLAFALCKVVYSGIDEKIIAAEKEQAVALADKQLTTVKTGLSRYEQIAHAWSALVIADGGKVENFETVSQQLYDRNPTITAIELEPDGVVTYSYPANKDIDGYNVLTEDPHKNDAVEAKDNGDCVISGPVDLHQGGTGLILRYPITVNNEFWGFAAVVIAVPDFYTDLGLDSLTESGYTYTLTKVDNDEELLLAGTEDISDSAVAATMIKGRRVWTLKIIPTAGWLNTEDDSHIYTPLVVGVLAGLAMFMVMMILRRNRELEDMRSDLTIQTKALAASEKANRMQAKALEVSKKANEMQVEALNASKRANKAQIEALNLAKKENKAQARQLEASEASNRAKTEFISRISHDIRTPIGAIKNLTEFAMQDMDDKEKLKEDLEKIDTSNKFLLSLINDVLDISRIGSGKVELVPEPYPYDEYITNIRNILGPMCEEKKQHWEVSSTSRCSGVIAADKIRINQIVLNILSNAVKYTPEGGTITYVSESEDMEDNKIMYGFSITDTGIGMSEDFQKRMFEEFAQEYDNPHREHGTTGTGLGLAIVKRMIDLMGGTIDVKSALGEGTCVRVRISFPDATRDPAFKDAMEKIAESETPTYQMTGRLLVVEDNEINQEIAMRMFEDLGFVVDVADNGQAGVDMFQSAPVGTYKAIFMDIQMPVMNGYDATRTIRHLDRDDALTVPIIAMTADAFDEAARKAEQSGMDEYVTKPLDLAYIIQILHKFDA